MHVGLAGDRGRPRIDRDDEGAVLARRAFLSRTLTVAVAASTLPRLAMAQEKQVNVYNWGTYIGEDTLDEFTDATGISTRYDLFSSNDELFAKLREGNPGYDVIFPSNNFVERMIVANMLQPLDHAQLPNITNVYYGRQVGYSIERIELTHGLEAISATDIRARIGQPAAALPVSP